MTERGLGAAGQMPAHRPFEPVVLDVLTSDDRYPRSVVAHAADAATHGVRDARQNVRANVSDDHDLVAGPPVVVEEAPALEADPYVLK